MAESSLVGLLGALGGVGLGWALLRFIVEVRVPDVLPEIGMRATLSAGTLLAAGLVGVVAVALAPLLTVRRLRRMDVPAALRVVE
jgi:putative ABC transport system permease protein